jgi:hypothetical protein
VRAPGSAASLSRSSAQAGEDPYYAECDYGEEPDQDEKSSTVDFVIRIEGGKLPSFPDVPKIGNPQHTDCGSNAHAD